MLIHSHTLDKYWWSLITLAVVSLLATFTLALSLGAATIPLQQVLAWLIGNADAQHQLILSQIRLPRAILA